MRAGLPARISLDAFPDRTFPGARAPRGAVRARSREAGAHGRDRSGVRRPREGRAARGYSADVEVVLDERADVLRVPTSVILPDDDRARVRRATGTIASRAVETGIANWEFTEIVERPRSRRPSRELHRPRRRRRRRRRDAGIAARRPPMMELSGICREYVVGEETVHALDDVDLTIGAGEYVSIMGPSGSGKSTLLNVLGLLDRPTAGTYRLQGEDVSQSRRRRARGAPPAAHRLRLPVLPLDSAPDGARERRAAARARRRGAARAARARRGDPRVGRA